MDTENSEFIELIQKIEKGELTDDQKIALLKRFNLSYDVFNKFLEEIRQYQLKKELQ